MGFAEPAAWLFAALAAVLWYLHWRQRRQAVQVVPALFVWPALPPPRRRQWDLLLLLQLAILFGLVAALARPYSEHAGGSAPARHILVVDRTASMQARTGGTTRFEAARARAREYLERLSPGDEVALIAVGEEPEVLVPYTRDVSRVRAALLALVPYDSGGSLERTLAVAQSLRDTAGGQARIAVFSDFAGADIPRTWGPGVTWFPVGEGDHNLAITDVVVRAPAWHGPQEAEVEVRVHNYGHSPAHGLLLVDVAGRSVLRTGFTLAAGETQTFAARHLPTAGDIVATVAADDLLAADNTAVAWLEAPAPLRLCLVSSAGGPWPELERLAAAAGRLQVLPAGCARQPQAADVFVYRGAPPTEPAAPALVVDVAEPTAARAAVRRDVTVAAWNPEHAIFSGWSPAFPLSLPRVRLGTLPEYAVPLLWGQAGEELVVLAWASEHGGRRIWFRFDPLQESLVRPDSFPLGVFFLESLAWLRPEPPAARAWVAGKALPLAARNGATVRLPSGETIALAPGTPAFVPHWRGRYEVRDTSGTTVLLVSANDPGEGDIAPRPPDSLPPGSEEPAPVRVPWQHGVLATVLALLVLETAWRAWRAGREGAT